MLPEPLVQVRRTYVKWRGGTYSYFGGCDYFRLSSEPRVVSAFKDAAEKFGISIGASRRTTGNHPIYVELEERLSEYFTASATLVSSGYLSNSIAAQALADEISICLIDDRSHPSLFDAAQATGKRVVTFAHQQPGGLREALAKLSASEVPLVLTDGMFSYDGAIPPLNEYLAVMPRRSWMLVDDAHAAGLVAEGKGTPALFKLPRSRVVQTITFSKAFGTAGGAILSTEALRARIMKESRAFVGSTPPPLPVCSATIEALKAADASRRERLHRNVNLVRDALGLPSIEAAKLNPILPIYPNSPAARAALYERLQGGRVFPPLINYPGAAAEQFFRFAISSEHTDAQLRALIDALTA